MAHHPAAELEFREFVANRSAALQRTAYLLVGDWAHAEDVVQVALTRTYLAWHRIADRDAVEPYVRRVLVNTVTSWWRKRWHAERPTGTLPEPTGTPDPAVAHADRDLLWTLVKRLPVRQRAVLVLRYYEDLTEAETARLLGVSIGTVKSQCSRAIATLRRQLGSGRDAQRGEAAGQVVHPLWGRAAVGHLQPGLGAPQHVAQGMAYVPCEQAAG